MSTIFHPPRTGAQTGIVILLWGRRCALPQSPLPPFLIESNLAHLQIYDSTNVFQYSPFKSSNSYADMHTTLTLPLPPKPILDLTYILHAHSRRVVHHIYLEYHI